MKRSEAVEQLERLRFRSHLLRRCHYRFDNLLVAGASAQIAVHEMFQLRFRRTRIFVEQRFRRQDHSRRAKAALKPAVFDEGLLQRVQIAIIGQAFDG